MLLKASEKSNHKWNSWQQLKIKDPVVTHLQTVKRSLGQLSLAWQPSRLDLHHQPLYLLIWKSGHEDVMWREDMNGWEHIGGLQQHQVPTFYSGDCAVQASHLLSTSKYTHHRRWKYIEHRIPYWTLLKQHYYHHPVCGKTYKQLLNVSLSQHV